MFRNRVFHGNNNLQPPSRWDKAMTQQEENNLSYDTCRNLIDNIDEIIFQTDTEGKWLFLNKRWTSILGYEVKDSIGQPFLKYVYQPDIKHHYQLHRSGAHSKINYNGFEIRYVAKNGELVWMKVHAINQQDERGNIIGITGTLRDITAYKKTQELVELVSNNICDLVCLHDRYTNFQYVSPSITSIAGYLPAELLNKNPYSYFHPEDIEKYHEHQQQITNNPELREHYVTYRFRAKSGQYRWFETNTKPIWNEAQELSGYVTTSRLINLRKEAEDQAILTLQRERELNQKKSRFVNFVSHEFRTPLASISSSIELMEMYVDRNGTDHKALKRHLRNVMSEVDRISLLIEEVLIVGKIESDGFDCKREPVSIEDMVASVIEVIEKVQVDNRKAELKINGPPTLTMADPMLLRHAVSNLVSNAFKYSYDKPPPIVEINFEQKEAVIKVIDSGIGIPLRDQKNIFKPFFRSENARSINGTGLGMFITKYFIDLQGGKLTFKSSDKGSEFTIRLNYV
ncbi:PAS domain S-box protein [Mucilaginibacter sp. RS28]|uniref:histidine kinase n=1 Tax=Mucilaginibacter straminoryzae TaxID=2932774 RepID=A0A9X1X3Y5_9SPHI|nr:PAS domain S-box protein [Mucilaginibacter straminoryzae]MCJ8209710.1 PAS domain S-box protein [Mucilaginibacter straminoryzae]